MLCTIFPLLGYLDDLHGGFLKLWMDSLGFVEFPDLIEYYTIIGNGTLLKEEYTTVENHTLLKEIDYLMYLTQPNFLENNPNQIFHMLSILFRVHISGSHSCFGFTFAICDMIGCGMTCGDVTTNSFMFSPVAFLKSL